MFDVYLIMNCNDKALKAYFEAYNGVKVKENEKIVLESKTYWSFAFALNIPGAKIKKHEQIILELKDPQVSFLFAKDIPGANIEQHFKVIYNSGDKVYFDLFIEEVNYKNTKVEKWLLYI